MLSLAIIGSMIACKQENVVQTVISATDFKLLSARDNKGVAAKVSNQVWYSSTTAGTDYLAIRGGISPDELTLVASGSLSTSTTKKDKITLFIKSATAIGTYDIGGNTQNNGNYSTVDSKGNLINYATDATRKGTVKITVYDTKTKLLSGTFSFQAISPSGTIELQEGEFQNVPF